jgi:hypothetical protein
MKQLVSPLEESLLRSLAEYNASALVFIDRGWRVYRNDGSEVALFSEEIFTFARRTHLICELIQLDSVDPIVKDTIPECEEYILK